MLQNVTAEKMEQSESILPIFAVHLRRFDLMTKNFLTVLSVSLLIIEN